MKLIKKLLLASVLLSFAGTGVAMDEGEYSLDLTIGSKHSRDDYFDDDSGRRKDYNEQNFGLGLSYAYMDNLDIRGGFFKNSYDKTSAYLGVFWHKDYQWDDISVSPGVNMLLVTGYDDTPEDAPTVAPFPLPAVSLGYRDVRLHVGYQPFGHVNFWTLQLQVPLGKL